MDDGEANIDSSLYVICRKDEKTDGLRECSSGISKVIEYGTLFGLSILTTHLNSKQSEGSHVKTHASCQKNIGNSIRKRKANPYNSEKSYKAAKIATRSSIKGFNRKENFLFCGKECEEDKKHPDRGPIYQVTFLHYRETILKICNSREEDPWASEVERRIINCIDLVQEEARYHDDCRAKFTSRKPEKVSSQQKGRPQNNIQQCNFEILCKWLKTEGELYSLLELYDKMKEVANSDEVYTRKWLKTKLKNKYGEEISFWGK